MKDLMFKVLKIPQMEIAAPLGGGGAGLFAWAVQLAPIISIIAAIIGIVLGVMSYILKRKKHNIEMQYYQTKVQQLKNQQQ